eukprot:7044779-Alexandrium_andersonii.AAC.1
MGGCQWSRRRCRGNAKPAWSTRPAPALRVERLRDFAVAAVIIHCHVAATALFWLIGFGCRQSAASLPRYNFENAAICSGCRRAF